MSYLRNHFTLSTYIYGNRALPNEQGLWRANDPPWHKHFQNPGRKFNKHTKFKIIEKISSAPLPKQQKRSLLEHREDSLSLSKKSEHILKPYPRHYWFHLVKLFQFFLSLVSALFLRSFLKFLLSRG